MSSFLPVTAFVLKQRQLREKDVSITLFTREKGKIFCIAKGMRALTSRRSAHIQTGNLIDTQLRVHTSKGNYLTQTSLHSGFASLKTDQRRTQAYYLCLFLVDRLLPDGLVEERVFALLLEATKRLTYDEPKQAAYMFATALLQELGYGSHDFGNSDTLRKTIEPLIQEAMPSFV